MRYFIICLFLIPFVGIQAQDHKYQVSFSTGINTGYFFDERPWRMSMINLTGDKNGQSRKRLLVDETFFQSMELVGFKLKSKFGIGLSYQQFFSSRYFDGPFEKDQFIRDQRLNISIIGLYKHSLKDNFNLISYLGIGSRQSYNEFIKQDGLAKTFIVNNSKDFAGSIGFKVKYNLPYNFNIGSKISYYYAFYREEKLYNTPHDLFIDLTIGYTLGIKKLKD